MSQVSSVFLRKMTTKKKDDSNDHLAVLDNEILGKQKESNHLSIIDQLKVRAGSWLSNNSARRASSGFGSMLGKNYDQNRYS